MLQTKARSPRTRDVDEDTASEGIPLTDGTIADVIFRIEPYQLYLLMSNLYRRRTDAPMERSSLYVPQRRSSAWRSFLSAQHAIKLEDLG